ncbi:fatty acyl-AMP ligase [Flavilitoribacter nigricans]|uniref:Fatty acyl-AMP ligase n=1 Tax=Flavilitoribacter nigricans (strain ATCC 23147 / DSM 23189 / NBRC 102662 / NCIMB 1420 / SS-2) TaxID=1122177 RepID=A0A2D0NAG1_FLAN2|nr:fatty acyl-AMP ligase [Flavilitoribacter nigricans]PHN05501.1 fatty acyl-AMP ligase [Flavilitoribacter nigricans DSM 23189 = NBRC 102662]
MKSVIKRFNEWVDKNPEQRLFAFLDVNGNIKEDYTYQEFEDRSKIIAAHLMSEFKFKQNDRVLLAYPPGIEMICAFFACVRSGLIPVPTYPPSSLGYQSSMSKMDFIAADCGAVGVLTSQDYYWSLKLNLNRNNVREKNRLSQITWVNTSEISSISVPDIPERQADILFLQYTSGSTSSPKGVMVSHENIIYNGDIVIDHYPITGVSWLPQYHDMGLIGYYLFLAIKGGTNYGFSPIDFIRKPSLWLETISKYRGTASSAPNFAYEYCLQPGKLTEETLNDLDLSCLRSLMTAAEPVDVSTYQRFLEFFKPYGLDPQYYFTAYGLAENTLALSNHGRKFIAVNRQELQENRLLLASPGQNGHTTSSIMSCGKPLGDHQVRIVDPESCTDLGADAIGEIWVSGPSKCLGYWNKPTLTKETFEAEIPGDASGQQFLRTGDLGLLHEGEVYVCGRLKDMIIIRGLNYYPQDVEKIVEKTSKEIREGYVAAFGLKENGEEHLIVVVGIKSKSKIPDPFKISEEIRKKLNILPHTITFVPNKIIPRTSSGKIMRRKAKQLWMEDGLQVIKNCVLIHESEARSNGKAASPFDEIKHKYGFTGEETFSLVSALDSLDLVLLLNDLKELLKKSGAPKMAKEIDTRLLQEISVSEFFDLIEQFDTSSLVAIHRLKNIISKLQSEHKDAEQRQMLRDVKLNFKPESVPPASNYKPTGKILLTGGTGFLGPFILKSLLEQTDDDIYVLVRSENDQKGRERLIEGMKLAGIYELCQGEFEDRVIAVRGDMNKARLGMDEKRWKYLTENIHAIYNNGALVNYLFNYEKMKGTNVSGTNEVIKFAFAGIPKILNHVSTTFIFGWAVKDVLYETDTNDSLDLLDFGYSQTKWVSEEIVKDAMKYGLQARIFRPALITPSVHGGGNNFDISIRLLAFMINHGIGVDTNNQVSFTPVDVVGNNIVAISALPDTINKTFHIVRDNYNNMMDITDIISKLTDQEFNNLKLPQFVPQIVDRCTKDDLLFPLLDFLIRSVENISAMELKLYSNQEYQEARNRSKHGAPDPSLEETVRGMLLFMQRKEVINVKMKV